MRRVCSSAFLLSAMFGWGQQWQAIDFAPCYTAEMTAAGAGFCAHTVAVGQGGSFEIWQKIFYTADDWTTAPLLVGQTPGLGGLFCQPEQLVRSSPEGIAFEFECMPSFIGTASLGYGMSNVGGALGAFSLEDFDDLAPIGDTMCFVTGALVTDYVVRLMYTGPNALVAYDELLVLPGADHAPATLAFVDQWNGVFTHKGIGDSLVVLVTSDGGASWQQTYATSGSAIVDSKFLDQNVVWLVGEAGLILQSVNAGVTWQPVSVPATCDLVSVDGYSPDSVWVACQNGSVFATGDGGISWTSILPLPAGVREIQTLDGAIYGHTGNGTLYRYFAAGDPNGIEEPGFAIRGTDLIVPLKANETLNRCSILSVTGAALVDRTGAWSISMAVFSPGLYVVVAETDQRHLVGRVLWAGE